MIFKSVLISLLVLTTACQSQTIEVKEKKKTTVTLPGYEIDLVKKEVRMKAKVCLTSGILEYLLCLPNSFEHEAIFVTKAKPELLHTGLLLVGYTPLQLYKLGEKWWQEVPKKPSCRLNVSVNWQQDGKKKSVPMHKLLLRRKKTAGKNDANLYARNFWVFNGSFFYEKQYIANLDMTVMAIMPQSSSVIQYGERSVDPYSGDQFGFEINNALCPPYNTEVEIVFSAYKKDKAKDKDKTEVK